mmetsp:Transcript_2496/g.7135  ORF Transcript_2496/g.7135 Transcript_2496/m.7135 type:complete len:213 (+) Transcript_2496:419-1057(+)
MKTQFLASRCGPGRSGARSRPPSPRPSATSLDPQREPAGHAVQQCPCAAPLYRYGRRRRAPCPDTAHRYSSPPRRASHHAQHERSSIPAPSPNRNKSPTRASSARRPRARRRRARPRGRPSPPPWPRRTARRSRTVPWIRRRAGRSFALLLVLPSTPGARITREAPLFSSLGRRWRGRGAAVSRRPRGKSPPESRRRCRPGAVSARAGRRRA